MRLINGEIRPGVVLEVLDEYGTIKGSCLGVFSDEDDPNLLPPIHQWPSASGTCFNQPKVNDPIWVLFFNDNPQELFYFFQADIKNHSSHILGKKPKDAQILASRDSEMGKAQLYYSSDDGWKLSKDDTRFQIDKDNNITMQKEDLEERKIAIDEDGVFIGEKENSQPAVLGNELQDCLNKIYNALQSLQMDLAGNPYTSPAAVGLGEKLPAIYNQMNKVLSKTVSLT